MHNIYKSNKKHCLNKKAMFFVMQFPNHLNNYYIAFLILLLYNNPNYL